MARFKTANEAINQVASEIGLTKVADVTASTDPMFVQLVDLANACGEELLETEEWQTLRRQHNFTTDSADTGKYSLPADFAYMIEQTNWERSQNVPNFGPVSPQEWAYLAGRDLVSTTLYASFRLTEGEFWLFPYAEGIVAVPDGLEIYFEYISRNWVLDEGVADTYTDIIDSASDVILYDFRVFERLLKFRWLEARGFDTTTAERAYLKALGSWAGKDKSAPVLSTTRGGRTYPWLDTWRNTPDSGFGS